MRSLALMLVLLFACSGCHRQRASSADCAEILDRVVALELGELGFRDPALVDRKTREVRTTFAGELNRCEGGGMKPGAMDCVRAARTTEEISHRCLR